MCDLKLSRLNNSSTSTAISKSEMNERAKKRSLQLLGIYHFFLVSGFPILMQSRQNELAASRSCAWQWPCESARSSHPPRRDRARAPLPHGLFSRGSAALPIQRQPPMY